MQMQNLANDGGETGYNTPGSGYDPGPNYQWDPATGRYKYVGPGDPAHVPGGYTPGAVPWSPDYTPAPGASPYDTPTDTAPPPAAPPPPPAGGGGAPNIGDAPTFTAPNLPNISPFTSNQNPYEYQPFDNSPYVIPAFKPPTLQDAQNEPGYEFARKEGLRALENANLPTLRSGGTLKNLIGWGDRFAEQNYGNVYNRDANTYGLNTGAIQANRNNAFGANQANNTGQLNQFTTNFGASKDIWDRNTNLAENLYNLDLQGRQAGFNGSLQEWLAKLNSLTQIGTAGATGA